MALARVKTWIAGEVLTASDLNAEFSNILNNPGSLITPVGFDLTFTDGTYDIGKSGATRPRDGFFSRNVVIGNTLTAGDTAISGNMLAAKSVSGSNVSTSAENTSNTADSGAVDLIRVAGSSAGDPVTQYQIAGVQNWTIGIDNSDSDKFVIAASNALGTSNRLTITTGGAVAIPGTLDVTGLSTLGSASVTGGASVGGTLGVTGVATFSNTLSVPAATRLYLDGGSNTWIEEVSADVVRIVSGGTAAITFAAAGPTITGSLVITGAGSTAPLTYQNSSGTTMLYAGAANLGIAAGESATNAMLYVRKDSTTSCSIKAAGTIGASGADFAEYEVKALGCRLVAKGQLIGFDAEGRVTDRWADAVSGFGIKTTNPNLVGGDSYMSEEAIGMARPVQPVLVLPEDGGPEYEARCAMARVNHQADMAEFELAMDAFSARLEAARQPLDRISYSGKVPVNVTGAAVGDYIIAEQDGEGIKGVPVASPSFEQYLRVVGRVRAIGDDGRPVVAVMVH